MISQTDLSGKFAYDTKGLDQLRQTARQDAPEALKSTAQQFEALFMNMVMKSMREATPKEGLFDSEQEKMMTSMLDQQLSQTLAKRGVGLADTLVLQLSKTMQMRPEAALNGADATKNATMSVNPLGNGADAGQRNRITALNNEITNDPSLRPFAPGRLGNMANRYLENSNLDNAAAKFNPQSPETQKILQDSTATLAASEGRGRRTQPDHVREFQQRVGKHADEASRETGIPAKFMLGQAALESGWGKREMFNADGSKSHNLFGIKATAGWKGKTVDAVTTEYVNGVPTAKREKFRAYDSYADSFRDYAKLLSKNPRYENVLAQTTDASSFAKGLQRAGYATDPHYASKLTRIINQSFI